MSLSLHNPYESYMATDAGGYVNATHLVSGTAVQVLSVGLDLTAPWSAYILTTTIGLAEANSKLRKVIKPTVCRIKSSKRKLGLHKQFHSGQILEVMFGHKDQHQPKTLVIHEKIRAARFKESTSSMRLLGRQGSTLPPSAKHYDLDLDEFQLD